MGSWALESKARDPCALEPWAEAPGALESGAQEPCAKKSCALELKVQESVQSPGVLGPGGLAYARGGSFCVVHMQEKRNVLLEVGSEPLAVIDVVSKF